MSAVVNSSKLAGWMAFTFSPPNFGSDVLNDGTTPVGGGQMIAQDMQTSPATQGSYNGQAFSQQLCQLSQSLYPNIAADTQTALQQAQTDAQQALNGTQSAPQTDQQPSPIAPSTPSLSSPPGQNLTATPAAGGVTPSPSAIANQAATNQYATQLQSVQMEMQNTMKMIQQMEASVGQVPSASTVAPPTAQTPKSNSQDDADTNGSD